jgi:hypothetical protein
MTRLLFLLFTLFFLKISSAQKDALLLLNGKNIEGKVISIGEEFITLETGKNGKLKLREIDTYRVFSILYNDGQTKILYEYDTLVGNYYTAEEMYLFIKGEQDARSYHPLGLLGAVYGPVSIGGSLLLGGFFSIGVPLVTTTIAVLIPPRVRKRRIPNPELATNEAYRHGYKRVAKEKRMRMAIKTSILGTIAGYAGYHLYYKKVFDE